MRTLSKASDVTCIEKYKQTMADSLVNSRTFVSTLSYTCVEILHTLFYITREHFHFMNDKLRLNTFPVSLNSTKHRCKTFSECFISIKWQPINYYLGATFGKKTAATDLASESEELTVILISGNSYWSDTVSVLFDAALCGYACVARSPHAHNSARTALFTTIQCACCYEYYIFIGQWDSLLSGLRLECFFFSKKKKYLSHLCSSAVYLLIILNTPLVLVTGM